MHDTEKGKLQELPPDPSHEVAAAKLWAVYVSEAERYDKSLVESRKNDVEGMLIFWPPTLTIAPATPFTPSATSLVCNILWFISLGLSLTCPLIVTLLEQWARDFLHKADMQSAPVIRARVFSYLYYGLRRFGMHTVVEIIPLLHTSLLFIFAGLVAFLIPVNTALTVVAGILLAIVTGLCGGSFTKFDVVYSASVEVPSNAHIGSIRHQGQKKYGNVAVSGIISSACDHALVGAFIDMLIGEAFGLGTYAQREHLSRTNTPPHGPASTTSIVGSYDSWCSFSVNKVKQAELIFPEDTWFHQLLWTMEGQIPADHINGHRPGCQTIWQAVYFTCRAHFHGETVEVIWAFLNALGSSTRQMTAAARHDIINFVIHAWNTSKILCQASLLAAERIDALQLFELHMAVLEDLSRQHATEVDGWSQLSRLSTKSGSGKLRMLTIDNVLASLLTKEREQEKPTPAAASDPTTSVAQWSDGMEIERQQVLVIALLKNHQEHPLQKTWSTVTKRRDSLNVSPKKFRGSQGVIYPRLKLSALDVDEPELTAIQLPSYHMKHGQRPMSGPDVTDLDSQLREAETKLQCSQVDNGIVAVCAASLALSATTKARDLDYPGQLGKTYTHRNIQKAQLMKFYEMEMYNRARACLIHLGHMGEDTIEPYPPMTARDTRRKETHLHRVQGDSQLFDGTAWYLQSGGKLSDTATSSPLSPIKRLDEDEERPRLLAGTQVMKRADDVAVDGLLLLLSSEAEDSDLEMSPSKRAGCRQGVKKKGKKGDGWIWLENVTRGQKLGEGQLANYKQESDRLQWFRTEAEMYRWLEAYGHRHAELFRVIARFRRDSAHNAEVLFKAPESGTHYDWVATTTFDKLVIKIDAWRNVLFKWMDEMGIHRAYKDF
ncbi:hypothetical protein DFH09DRAFT_1363193 [Mycena vulgaris]|nr:hypothetical protein DFH09DRAFT_1363193 [Mycena vulgaris]